MRAFSKVTPQLLKERSSEAPFKGFQHPVDMWKMLIGEGNGQHEVQEPERSSFCLFMFSVLVHHFLQQPRVVGCHIVMYLIHLWYKNMGKAQVIIKISSYHSQSAVLLVIHFSQMGRKLIGGSYYAFRARSTPGTMMGKIGSFTGLSKNCINKQVCTWWSLVRKCCKSAVGWWF